MLCDSCVGEFCGAVLGAFVGLDGLVGLGGLVGFSACVVVFWGLGFSIFWFCLVGCFDGFGCHARF